MHLYRHSVTELYTPGTAITAHSTEDVVQGQFVELTDSTTDHPTVKVAQPGNRAFGLVMVDTNAEDLVGIQRGNGRCFRVPTDATITAGADLEVGASGQPVPAVDGVVVAQALHSSQDGHVDITLI